MNKNDPSVLTPSDKQLLKLIGQRFELVEQIIGPEPGIYYEFDKIPELPSHQVIESRSEVFANLTAHKSKEIKK